MIQINSIAILSLKIDAALPTSLSAGRRFVELRVGDAERLSIVERGYGRRGNLDRIRRRFDYGLRCFAVEDDSTLIAWVWVAPVVRYLDELQWLIPLDATQVWLRDAFVAPACRGQRLMETLMWKAWDKVGRPARYLSDVETSNRSSMRLHLRMGFSEVAVVRSVAIGRRLHLRVRPPQSIPHPQSLRPWQRVLWMRPDEFDWHRANIA
jgi:GNAT superfamily N-acetyltransferase